MKSTSNLPQLIQGGMGMGISHWKLAQAVAKTGQLGVVSGTAIDSIFVRRLQQGDPHGHMRRAMKQFPNQSIVQEILKRYYIPNGKQSDAAFRSLPLPQLHNNQKRNEVIILANFCEIYLAKEHHGNPIGINLLEKIALPNLPSLFGALLAGVDVVCMGAGIPHWCPEALDLLSTWETAKQHIPVINGDSEEIDFNPNEYGIKPHPLQRPQFLAIISSDIIGKSLLRRSKGRIDGFIVENYAAGGHNAPPRKKHAQSLADYGEKDMPNYNRIAALGLPFWIAGAHGNHEMFLSARQQGAHGIQVGTPFAFCTDSGMDAKIRHDSLSQILDCKQRSHTDFQASPTGYPFKILDIYKNIIRNNPENKRFCDLGYLRSPVKNSQGRIEFRCPAEPITRYKDKGGNETDCNDKVCLCNGLLATCGVPQQRASGTEAPLITASDDTTDITALCKIRRNYSALDVVNHIIKDA